MKITILITTYNRPAYLKRCLASLKRANLRGAEILIVDDASNEPEVFEYIKQYNYRRKPACSGICHSLLYGIKEAFDEGAEIVINLDADAIVRNDFLQVLLDLHAAFPDDIITGFHSTTKNADGSERHKIIDEGKFDAMRFVEEDFGIIIDNYVIDIRYAIKQSVGGINMLWTQATWQKYKPVIENAQAKGLNWDHQVSLAACRMVCAVPSVIQHIGFDSAMNHREQPDIADDFKMLSLPDVTLVCVDDNIKRCEGAIEESCRNIIFGNIHLICGVPNTYFVDTPTERFRVSGIPELGSKEAYSHFILRDLHKYISTPYVLIIQHDGYVKNPEAWTDEFLQYDYIGAPWWFKDGMNVGNGGFSLRSMKLLKTVAAMPLQHLHPEDNVICRTHRKELESKGIKFAPETLAAQFSFEGYRQTGRYTNQFGFHGSRAFRQQPRMDKEGFIINQFLGLGDILFLVPLVRKWIDEEHDVIWPIADEYFEIKKHFPDIQFVRKSLFPMNYDIRQDYLHRFQWGSYRVKALRWNLCRTPQEAMTSKYDMVHEDWKMWRELKWERNYEKEKQLAVLVHATGQYELICDSGGNITDGGAFVKPIGTIGLKQVKLQRIEGFTLLDWSGVIENATAIHAVSSSTLYMFEVLDLKCKEINLYARNLGLMDFEYVERLMTKKYNLHL